jgi:transposase
LTFENRKQKEEKVIEFYLEGKTVREIAKIVHMSFSDIGEIIRKYNERKTRENLKGDTIISDETKAIELLSKGKRPIEVKVLLNISTEEVEIYYEAYWKLIGLHQLYKYYETEIKNDLPSFLKLYSKAKERGIRNDDVVRALRYLDDIQFLGLRSRVLENEIKKLAIRKERLISELTELEFSINKFKNSFG